MPWRYLGGQGTGRRGLAPRGPQLEAGGDGRVDAWPEAGVGAVPGERDGVALGQNQVLAGVVEDELPLGEDVVELSPVVVERLAVLVVFGPDRAGEAADGVPEVRPLAVADYPRVHPASIPGPGAPRCGPATPAASPTGL